MSSKLLAYCNTLLESFGARDAGDIGREDELLAELDAIWLSMTAAEKQQSGPAADLAKAIHEYSPSAIASAFTEHFELVAYFRAFDVLKSTLLDEWNLERRSVWMHTSSLITSTSSELGGRLAMPVLQTPEAESFTSGMTSQFAARRVANFLEGYALAS